MTSFVIAESYQDDFRAHSKHVTSLDMMKVRLTTENGNKHDVILAKTKGFDTKFTKVLTDGIPEDASDLQVEKCFFIFFIS